MNKLLKPYVIKSITLVLIISLFVSHYYVILSCFPKPDSYELLSTVM